MLENVGNLQERPSVRTIRLQFYALQFFMLVSKAIPKNVVCFSNLYIAYYFNK